MESKKGKTSGLSEVVGEMFSVSEGAAVKWLASLGNGIIETKSIPGDWARSVLVPVYKGKSGPPVSV